jgi:hypothetical protein
MIRSKAIDDQLRNGRLDAKSRDNMFCRRIEQGANCAPFVAAAILDTVKEVFPIGPEDQVTDLGHVRLLVVAAHELAGKSLEQCQKVPVTLTLDAGKEDFEVRIQQGVGGLRRARILRVCVQAREQSGLLSYEDLAYRLFNCGVRTIVRDVEHLRRRGLVVPTRGQQQDIGPGQTHRVQAVRLFLEGHEPQEIARRLYHALSSVENYLTTFGRVVLLAKRRYTDDEIAFLVRRSSTLVAEYRRLARELTRQPAARRRLQEILDRLQGRDGSGKRAVSSEKKGGAQR